MIAPDDFRCAAFQLSFRNYNWSHRDGLTYRYRKYTTQYKVEHKRFNRWSKLFHFVSYLLLTVRKIF